MSHLLRLLPALLLCVALAVPASAQAQGSADWKRCKATSDDSFAEVFRCATVPVPLRHSEPAGAKLALSVRRAFTRRDNKPQASATVILVGGPGVAGPGLDANAIEATPTQDARSDLLLVDLRGTGQSGALKCAFSATGDTATEARACWERLGPARDAYTSAAAVADLEAVRIASGYRKLNLFATSYGTKLAYDYAATYPASTGYLVLDSVVPPEGLDPWMSSSLRAAPRLVAGLCASGRCRGVTADAAGDLRTVAQTLRPGAAVMAPDRLGVTRELILTERELLAVALAADVDPLIRYSLPGALSAARRGDLQPLARLSAVARGTERIDIPAEAFSVGAYLATICEETSFPWDASQSLEQRRTELQQAASVRDPAAWGPFSPAVVSELPLEACIGWPTAGRREVPVRSPLPNTRTLMLSGSDDLRTPLEDAGPVATRIPGAALVRVAGSGHSVYTNQRLQGGGTCGQRRWVTWLARKPVASTCTDWGRGSRLYPAPPTSLAQLRPARGYSGNVGRTMRAVEETIQDAFGGDYWASQDRERRIGGLRGGSMRTGGDSATLRKYEYIPGVQLSGKLRFAFRRGQTTRFKVTGPAASQGYVVIDVYSDAIVGGRLGGKRL